MKKTIFTTLLAVALLAAPMLADASTLYADKIHSASVSILNHWLEISIDKNDVSNITGPGCLSGDGSYYIIRLPSNNAHYKEALAATLTATSTAQPIFMAFDKVTCELQEIIVINY